MKRLFSLFLAIAMVFSITACTGNENSSETTTPSTNIEATENTEVETEMKDTPSTEVSRAIAFGLVPEEIQDDYDTTITFRQYSEMLTNMVRIWDESRLSEWEETISLAAASDEEMQREDGILATAYAMALMGKLEYSRTDWTFFEKVQEHKDNGIALTGDYPQFPTWEEIAFPQYGSNYMWGGITMCAVETSRISGLAIYPYDFEAKSEHLLNDLTREEAICAVLRLAETEDVFVNNLPASGEMDYSEAEQWEVEFLGSAEERKQSILSNNESLSCTGTAYYVSNNGNDSNDGLSPETAWATVDRLNEQGGFAAGDGIYFERGGVFRGSLEYMENITLSAYGTGEKPRIYGSPENGADTGKWTLHSEQNGVKVWKYNNILPECDGIALNDAQKIAKRVYAWYDGTQHYFSEDMSTPFDITTALDEDLSFYCEMNYGYVELPFDPSPYSKETHVYLRCDEGNPGEVFDNIEFMCIGTTQYSSLIPLGAGSTLDNICVMYYAGTAVGAASRNGCTIQNCEIAYGGTKMFEIFQPTEDIPGIWTDGNGIHFFGSNNTITNNYIHDIGGHGINFEIGGDYDWISANIPFVENTISGNFVENCGEPIYVANNQDGLKDAVVFDGMVIDDNYLMNAGYGWNDDALSYINPSVQEKVTYICLNFGGNANVGESTIHVTNNVFYRAANFLVTTIGQDTDIPYFENNTFAQPFGEAAIRTAAMEVAAIDIHQTMSQIQSQYGDAGNLIILKP